MGEHLGSLDADLNQSQFLRMFALGFFDSLITLPISITSLVANIINAGPNFKFYQGWSAVHSSWDPVLVPKNLWSMDKIVVFSVYWDDWINPFFAFGILHSFWPYSSSAERVPQVLLISMEPFWCQTTGRYGGRVISCCFQQWERDTRNYHVEYLKQVWFKHTLCTVHVMLLLLTIFKSSNRCLGMNYHRG